jgi:hypothetical protein
MLTAYRSDAGASKISSNAADTIAGLPTYIHKTNVLTVFYRLFEAHFLPTQLALVLTTSGCYNLAYPSFLMPFLLKETLQVCSACRLISFGLMMCFFHRYEQYHRLCIGLRREEMREAGLLEGMVKDDTFSPNVFLGGGMFEAALFPLGAFIFGAIPALQAVVTHVFTERLTYTVSLKPQLLNRRRQVEEPKNDGRNTSIRTPFLDFDSAVSDSYCDAV